MFAAVAPVGLLIISNIFMTFAWYGHLKYPTAPLWVAVIGSWLLAFAEYCFAVPANRIGYGTYTAAELKTVQEVVTLAVFVGFAVFYLGERITTQHIMGFTLIVMGAALVFYAPK